MKRAAFACSALVALAACAMPPEGTTPEDAAAFDAAVSTVGCTLRTERDYLPIELQTGLSRDQAVAMAQYKVAVGDAVAQEDGGIRLVTGACAPAAVDPADADAADGEDPAA